MNTIEIRQCNFDTDADFEQLVRLQDETYRERGLRFNPEEFKQWYVLNPAGRVLSFNAYDGEKMVAHYACTPTQFTFDGIVEPGLLDISTVTHPDYRGKGLFKTLAAHTFREAKQLGYKFIIGVANDNSFPGYIKYFPFKFITRLEVKIGFGRDILPNDSIRVKGCYTPEFVEWRCRQMKCKYTDEAYTKATGSIIGVKGRLVQTFMGIVPEETLSRVEMKRHGVDIRPVLYVGTGASFKSPYITVPKFIKHSPFNLIFMDLTDGELPEVTKDNILFQLIDFDVA